MRSRAVCPRVARASARQRGYDGKWEKARKSFLRSNPLCAYCAQQGRTVAATVVDHVIPHKGDRKLFWDRKNWQPLCKPHHDSTKQAEERKGVTLGATTSGDPLDPAHHWNAKH